MSRPLAALFSLVLAVSGGVFLLSPQCAYACTCSMDPGSIDAERALADSEAVFSGEVVEIEKDLQTSKVTLRASEVWKGPQRETLEVSTPRYGMSCGYPFKEGQEYLVYAYTGNQGLKVDYCGSTRRLTEAQAHLEVLEAGKKPTGGGALSDTSGGVSAGAMVGVAGLVMAAALLVVVRLVRSGQK